MEWVGGMEMASFGLSFTAREMLKLKQETQGKA